MTAPAGRVLLLCLVLLTSVSPALEGRQWTAMGSLGVSRALAERLDESLVSAPSVEVSILRQMSRLTAIGLKAGYYDLGSSAGEFVCLPTCEDGFFGDYFHTSTAGLTVSMLLEGGAGPTGPYLTTGIGYFMWWERYDSGERRRYEGTGVSVGGGISFLRVGAFVVGPEVRINAILAASTEALGAASIATVGVTISR